MISTTINIILSVTISSTTLNQTELKNQLADINDLTKKEIILEIQSDLCINNIPNALELGSSNELYMLEKNGNNYVILK